MLVCGWYPRKTHSVVCTLKISLAVSTTMKVFIENPKKKYQSGKPKFMVHQVP